MTDYEYTTKVLKEYIDESVAILEKGGSVHVKGGYITHSKDEGIIDSHCPGIVAKLTSLGYEYTTNHGFGCKDYRFLKPIKL